jgi:hypothetical protein
MMTREKSKVAAMVLLGERFPKCGQVWESPLLNEKYCSFFPGHSRRDLCRISGKISKKKIEYLAYHLAEHDISIAGSLANRMLVRQ